MTSDNIVNPLVDAYIKGAIQGYNAAKLGITKEYMVQRLVNIAYEVEHEKRE